MKRTSMILILLLSTPAWAADAADRPSERPAPECECLSVSYDVVDTIWDGQAVTQDILEYSDCMDLRVYRNAVYARHGYNFTNQWVRNWFWYNEPRWTPIESVTDKTVGDQLSQQDHFTIHLVEEVEKAQSCSLFWDGLEALDQSDDTASLDAPDTVEPPLPPEFARLILEEVPVMGSPTGEMRAIAWVELTPEVLIELAQNKREIQAEWLMPLTCDELDELRLMTVKRAQEMASRDKLTVLYVDIARREKACSPPRSP